MERQTLYLAHQNDLYRVIFYPADGMVVNVTLYIDSNGVGIDLDYWRLPASLRERIQTKIDEYVQ